MQYYAEMWKNFAKFNGRATRAEYWYPYLVNFIIICALSFLVALAGFFLIVYADC